MTSELMNGVDVEVDDLCILHKRKSGMKRVRDSENAKRRLADQTRNRGYEQSWRPMKSPTLKTKKWIALNRSGLVAEFTGATEMVIGGKTAYTKMRICCMIEGAVRTRVTAKIYSTAML